MPSIMNIFCILLPMLLCATAVDSSGGPIARNIISHNLFNRVANLSNHDRGEPPQGAARISSLGRGGVSLRNSDRTPPGPASAQEILIQYESLCPDTVTFFRDLKDVYADDELRNRFTFELIPYGNVKLPANKKLDSSKPWGGRVCQHGERECWGNAWQACTHATLKERTRIMKHTICLLDLPKRGMPESYWEDHPWTCGDYKQCVVDPCDDGTLTAQEKKDIETCVGKVRNSQPGQGTMEMDSHEKAAELWNVTHVPWIVVNGKHVQDLDDNKISLRSYLESLPQPEEKGSNAGSKKSEQEEPDNTGVTNQDELGDRKEHPTGTGAKNPPQVSGARSKDEKSSSESVPLKLPQSSHNSGIVVAIGSIVLLLISSCAIYCMYLKNKGRNLAL